MKDKILQSLKNKYSNLGLGDEILTAQAETLASLNFITDENIETVIGGLENSLKVIQKANDKERTAKAKAEQDRLKLEQEKRDLEATLTKPPTGLTREEIEEMFRLRDEAKQAEQLKKSEQESRSNFITEKAKELGIPEWRLNEGFSIKDDFDDAKITEYLTGVKKNITTAGLEGKIGFPLDTRHTVSKEEADKIAKNLIY